MPGVASAMVTYGAPLDSWISNSLYRSGTGSDSARLLSVQPYFIGVPTEYFAVTRTRILNGRAFLPSDRAGTAPVIIVGDRLARDLWPGESAIGKCFIPLKPTNPCYTVVGVAQDVHHFQIVNRATETQYYFPLAQLPDPRSIPKSLVIRAGSLEPEPIARLVREEIRHAFPDAQVRAVPMSQALAPQLLPWRLGAELFTALSLLALAVAAIGVYGVVAFDVNQRVHEMGIRIALGAYTPRLIWLVVGQGTRIVAVGVVLGLLSALAAGKLVASML
jgi:hypothetical protein